MNVTLLASIRNKPYYAWAVLVATCEQQVWAPTWCSFPNRGSLRLSSLVPFSCPLLSS